MIEDLHVDYTPEQIDEIYKMNEGFHGKIASLRKIRAYAEIKRLLLEAEKACPDILSITAEALTQLKKNAVIYADMRNAAMFTKDALTMIREAANMADRVVMSTNKDAIRVSFCIEGIWAMGLQKCEGGTENV